MGMEKKQRHHNRPIIIKFARGLLPDEHKRLMQAGMASERQQFPSGNAALDYLKNLRPDNVKPEGIPENAPAVSSGLQIKESHLDSHLRLDEVFVIDYGHGVRMRTRFPG